MTDTTGIAIAGVAGRMGQMLARAVDENPATHISGATVRPGHRWIGNDLGECLGASQNGVIVMDDPLEVIAHTHALLDFTTPEATLANAELSAQARIVHVIGTTGFSDTDLAKLSPSGRHAVLIRAGNFSLGINLLTILTRQVAAALGADYDIEIIDAHHKHKVDAPSGTALMLGDAAADGRKVALNDVADRGHDGITGARKQGDIGFHAIRGGSVIGEHDVIFAGEGERLILSHKADDRLIFARGAVTAALWGQDKKPGEYDMTDVLGLRNQ